MNKEIRLRDLRLDRVRDERERGDQRMLRKLQQQHQQFRQRRIITTKKGN